MAVAVGYSMLSAALVPIECFDAVMPFTRGLATLFAKGNWTLVRYALINGLPGFVTIEADGLVQTTALDVEAGRIWPSTSCALPTSSAISKG